MKRPLIRLVILLATAAQLFAEGFEDLVRSVDQVKARTNTAAWADPLAAKRVAEEAIAHRKQMVIGVAASGALPLLEQGPKFSFPGMIARLMRNPEDPEA
jgi:hypothetical protein